MIRSVALFSSLLLTLAITSSSTPLVTIDEPAQNINLLFAVKLTTANVSLPEIDRTRARTLLESGQTRDLGNSSSRLDRRASSFSATNSAVAYTTQVGIGNPATSYTLLIDTGSSNTWVGARSAYKKTKTSISTGHNVQASYGSGSFSGTEYLDTVSLSPSLIINNQSIGAASSSQGFASSNVDGLLGLGPTDLTYGTLTDQPRLEIPTVSDNLFSQHAISSEVIGISFNPTTSTSNANGELTFGGVDSSKYTGSITYTPITSVSPSKYYWGIDQSITYGSTGTVILGKTAGIVDTGTTLMLIASDAFSKYQSITGATLDNATGLLRLTTSQFAKLQSLYFTIGGTKFEFTPNAQIWPRSLNQYIGGSSNYVYLIVSSTGQRSGSGMDFYNGYAFLERFYSVFDTSNSRVGFAVTSNTRSTSN